MAEVTFKVTDLEYPDPNDRAVEHVLKTIRVYAPDYTETDAVTLTTAELVMLRLTVDERLERHSAAAIRHTIADLSRRVAALNDQCSKLRADNANLRHRVAHPEAMRVVE